MEHEAGQGGDVVTQAAQAGIEHPAVDDGHEVVVLRRRNEGGGRQHVAVVVEHSDQDFETLRLGLIQRHDPLHVQDAAVALEVLAQRRDDLQFAVPLERLTRLGVVDTDPVAAGGLGGIAGHVGLAQHRHDRLGGGGETGQADAGADVVAPPTPQKWRDHQMPQPGFGPLPGGVERPRQHDAELVAAKTRQTGLGRKMLPQLSGHPAQQGVAGIVTRRVIDDLEPIEVEVQQGMRPGAAGTQLRPGGHQL